MSGRYSDLDEYQCSKLVQSRHHQVANLTTKISITAPSPRGSIREVNRILTDPKVNSQVDGSSTSSINRRQQGEHMIEKMTSELNLNSNCYISDFDQVNQVEEAQEVEQKEGDNKSRSELIDELLKTINDDSFNDLVDFNNKVTAQTSSSSRQLTAAQLANSNRPKSAIDSSASNYSSQNRQSSSSTTRPSSLALNQNQQNQRVSATPSTFDNVIRRMSTNFVQNFNKISATNLNSQDHQQQQEPNSSLRREKSSTYNNNLYVDNQVPARRHSDNTINIPRIQVALSSPQTARPVGLNQRASVSASKLANKWKLSAKTNKREASDKLSPNLSSIGGYIRRHSSGNTTGNDQTQSNGQTANLLINSSPFKVSEQAYDNQRDLGPKLLTNVLFIHLLRLQTKSSSNLGLDFLLSNRSMKRRYSAASMLGHQTQRKAEDLIDAGMKSVVSIQARTLYFGIKSTIRECY